MAPERWWLPNYLPDYASGIHHDYNSVAWGANFADVRLLEPVWDVIDVYGALPLYFYKSLEPEMSNLMPQIRAHGKKFGIIGGALGINGVDGATDATNELVQIDQIYADGGQVDYLIVDGFPINEMLPPLSQNSTTAIPQLALYMQTIHAAHPAIKIGLDVNFPAWQWNGGPNYYDVPSFTPEDYKTVLTNIVANVNSAGEKLWFVFLDGGYEHFEMVDICLVGAGRGMISGFQRYQGLRDHVHSLNLDFGLFVGSNANRTDLDDRAWANNSVKMITDWVALGGGEDKRGLLTFQIQPAIMLPVTTPYSYAHTYRRVMAL